MSKQHCRNNWQLCCQLFRQCCCFWQQCRTLLRHCCWCRRGSSLRLWTRLFAKRQ